MAFIFCNIGWMEHYKGQSAHDKIKGGGAYVAKEGRGHEVCNFAGDGKYFYGYVQPTGEQIKIERLGADKSDEQLAGVTVIWTASSPAGGTVIVGWYKDATVYRHLQQFKKIPALHDKNGIEGYRVMAGTGDVRLLPIDERTFEIPRRVKGGIGQANVWYADAPESMELLGDVKNYLEGQVRIAKGHRTKKTDPEKNARVEMVAIRTVTDYFENYGYEVDSVEKDNVGWDLEAISGKNKLRIEVKGLSGSGLAVELTPNEYVAFLDGQSNYRLCVVHSALTSPTLLICRHSTETGGWIVEDIDGAEVKIKPKQSASIEIRI